MSAPLLNYAEIEARVGPVSAVVASRRGVGGASRPRVKGMIAECRKALATERKWLAKARRGVETSDQQRVALATQMARL